MKKIFIFSIALIFVLNLSGCGKKSYVENKVEKNLKEALNQDVSVDFDENNLKIETEDGLTINSGDNVKIPDDFPKDIYILDGNIKTVMKNPVGGGYSITIETEKNVKDVKDIYSKKLVEDGWKLNDTMNLGEEMVVISGTKDANSVSVSITVNDEKTLVVVTFVSVGV